MSGERPLTAREFERAARTPTFDVYLVTAEAAHLCGGRFRTGDVIVRVSGVREPFEFSISEAVIRDASPFGRPTSEVIMRMARDSARQQCEQRIRA